MPSTSKKIVFKGGRLKLDEIQFHAVFLVEDALSANSKGNKFHVAVLYMTLYFTHVIAVLFFFYKSGKVFTRH